MIGGMDFQKLCTQANGRSNKQDVETEVEMRKQLSEMLKD